MKLGIILGAAVL